MAIRKIVKKEAAAETAKAPEKAEKKAVKAAAPKAAKAPKTPKAPKAAKTEEVIIQFGAMEWKTEDLVSLAKAAYVAEGHRASSIKSVSLYVKPEEQKAYYVVNDKATGSIDL